MAVAVTESGLNGSPNPYAMNIAGRAYHAKSVNDMANVIASNWARGVRSIDVGCMQVNLMYHGDKFNQLTDLLHSPTNVEYGASYLIQLATSRGSWREGVMDYHNKTSAARRRWYGCKVWNNYLRINRANTGFIACGAPPGGSSVASNAGMRVNTSPLVIPGYNTGSAPVAMAQNTISAGRVTASSASAATIGGRVLVNPANGSRPISAIPAAAPALASNVPSGSPLDSAPAVGGPLEQAYDVPQPRQRVRGTIEMVSAKATIADVDTTSDIRASAFRSVRPADWSQREKAETASAEPAATSTGTGGFYRAGPGRQ